MKENVEIQCGTSLAVRQFVTFLRGEDAPHEPSNPWRVEELVADDFYCLSCYGIRWFDVIHAVTYDGRRVVVKKCRCCGKEIEG